MLQPIAKRIIIQPIEQQSGALLLVNSKPTTFMVKAIGEDVTKVKIGDTIYLDKYSGMEIEYEKEKFLVIEENHILAKVSI